MDGTLIAYRLPAGSTNAAYGRLVKRLYGQETSAGGYRYRRRGLLDDLPHRRVIRGVIVLREGDATAVVRLLRELQAEAYVWRISLTREDRKALGL